MHRSVNEIARGRRIFIGFPDKFAKPAFYAGLVSLDFTGDNRRGAPDVQISAVIATQLRKACITQVTSNSSLTLSPIFAEKREGRKAAGNACGFP
jgi:hypothetical protein